MPDREPRYAVPLTAHLIPSRSVRQGHMRGRVGWMMSRASERSQPANRPLVLALVLTMAGGSVTAVGSVVDVPVLVGLSGLVLFLGGVLVALVLAYREARANKVSVLRAVGRAIKAGTRWFFYFMP